MYITSRARWPTRRMILDQEDHVGHNAWDGRADGLRNHHAAQGLPLAQAQHVCGFALHVRNGFEAATHRFGHVGAAEKAESHDRALFRGPDNAKLRQTEIQEIQLYQQRRVAAEFDVDAHNLLQHWDACDFNARADETDTIESTMPNTEMNNVIAAPLTKNGA